MAQKPCPCGSGHARHEIRDAAGIFLTFACDKCETAKRSRFNPSVFDARSSYAVTGDERDVGRYEGEDY